MAPVGTTTYEVFIWRDDFDDPNGILWESYAEEQAANDRADELVTEPGGQVNKAWVIKHEVTKEVERV